MPQQRHPGVEFEAVLDAAASCYLRFGVGKTTAADIAEAVGISRATLYRRFGSHEAIFLAVPTRESAAMAVDADAFLARFDDPRERMLEGMLYSIKEIGRRPVHAAVFGGDAVAWAATQAIQAEALRRIGFGTIQMAAIEVPCAGTRTRTNRRQRNRFGRRRRERGQSIDRKFWLQVAVRAGRNVH
ncbi:MAG TPA: helix-turn-helix domain-containing protein [Acidimicrobiales bacterium]|nr:helix-turn-helix domain-containing protein [Acidimicrobiales bacterium]